MTIPEGAGDFLTVEYTIQTDKLTQQTYSNRNENDN